MVRLLRALQSPDRLFLLQSLGYFEYDEEREACRPTAGQKAGFMIATSYDRSYCLSQRFGSRKILDCHCL